MRLIKFRAWDEENKKMIGPFKVGSELSEAWPPEMQFTGLHDKNGREIYGGDIVRWNEWESECVSMNWYSCQDESIFGWIAGNKPLDSKCEVIGNIYENPELLEDKW